MFVEDKALVARGGLLHTFYCDFRAVDAHADGVEANHLTDGIGDGFAVYGGGDAKVFQLVIKEVDFIGACLIVQLAQGIAERHIIVFSGDAVHYRTILACLQSLC